MTDISPFDQGPDPALAMDPVRARLMLFNDVSHYTDHPTRSSGRLSKWWDNSKE